MQAFLEYIMLNYTLFLGGAIIILLAIIGYYADKTNFGQGKKDEIKDNNLNLEELADKEAADEFNLDSFDELSEETELSENSDLIENQEEISPDIEVIENSQENISNQAVRSEINFEEEFEKFDKEFNDILPKKEIIDDELLDEIENLSLDKTQKIELSDIPDLDDVELPKIKSLEPEEEDVWKF